MLYYCLDCGISGNSELPAEFHPEWCKVRIRMTNQPTLPKLPSCFKEPSKTLKLEAIEGSYVGDVASQAIDYLWKQETYNRIEIKVGQTYLVVAKLKEK